MEKGGGVIASILLIEDDPQVRLLLRQLLEGEGHVVLQASNGRQGLRIAQMTSPDLVITDVLMPDKDGLEVTVGLHRESPATRIIAFSGSTEEVDYLAVAKILGAHRTLKKPLAVSDFLDAVEQELQIASRTARKNGYTKQEDAA